ncbi:MAG: ABC transporter ATP-binding protein [Coriobacteriia bacterium]|nr:ABC transporter ATP-binding protein [Coriobacteriia bacterium]
MAVGEAGQAIRIEHARKDYGQMSGGRREAVSDVSFTVSVGAIHGLLGPNGAGKTTTLKMLLGLVRPSGGTFEILGKDAASPGARSPLGFLPEQPYFPSHLSALEALTLYGRLAGMGRSDVEEAAPGLLERVGLDGQAKTQLSRFSRGMLQRFGLAQAWLKTPSVMVLDEPASGLDPIGQRDVRNLMLEFRERGATVLLSSHQLSEVEAVCDEVTILNRGLVAARGHIDDLLNVKGQCSVTVRGSGPLPTEVEAVVTETASSGERRIFSIAEKDVRRVVDALDDSSWKLVSVVPKRDSLEDYFSRMLAATPEPATPESAPAAPAESAAPADPGTDVAEEVAQ